MRFEMKTGEVGSIAFSVPVADPDGRLRKGAMVRGAGWAGPGRSPDRADAMVWALSELLLGKARVEPAVRRF